MREVGGGWLVGCERDWLVGWLVVREVGSGWLVIV